MRRASRGSVPRPSAPRTRWLAPLLAAAVLVVAAPASGVVTPSGSTGAAHDATIDHTRPSAAVDAGAVVTDRTDRRDTPTGRAAAPPVVALLGAGGVVLLARRRVRIVRPRAAFRRRAPPLLGLSH